MPLIRWRPVLANDSVVKKIRRRHVFERGLMRKLMIALLLTIAAATFFPAPKVATAYYYSDGGFYGGYGPYYDCNGYRCYIGPPYIRRRYHGHYYRVPGLYYYGPYGGYSRVAPYN